MARMRIKDIAAQAQVSPATVSKFLNGHFESMSAATRQRIAEVVERTGYRPSSVARNLRLDRSRTLGVILADIANPYSGAMLGELSAQAGEAGYALTCAISGNDPARECAAVDRLLDAGVDGLIVNTCGGNDALLAATDARLPVVLLDRDVEGAEMDLVTSNNDELVTGIVAELAASGARELYLLGEHSDTSSTRRERMARFAKELAARRLGGGSLVLGDDARAAGAWLRDLARDAAPSPIGLVAINGLVFQRLVGTLADAGLDVPGQVRLATFDEYPWNRVLFGGVTTVAQDTRAIAAATLVRVIGRVDGAAMGGANVETHPAHEPRRLEIPGSIIVRASTRARP